MPCSDQNIAAIEFGIILQQPYSTKEDCEKDCDGPTGACCNGATCRTVKPCQCVGTNDQFMGIRTTCSPNPCNPLP
jgi:hypothetical protein